MLFGDDTIQLIITVVGIILGVTIILATIFSWWKKVPQDRAGVVTGRKKRVITGSGGIVIPVLERIDYISLGNIPLSVQTRGSLSSQGVPISVCTTAVIKVKNTTESILSAIEQFTGRNEEEIKDNIETTANAVLEGKLREIIATMTVEDLYMQREAFSSKTQELVSSELGNMGLEVKNFTITDISDENGYIQALGEGMIAQRKKDAEIQKAEARKEQDEKTSDAKKAGEQAIIKSETEIAMARKEKEVRELEFKKETETAAAEAELAKEIQLNKTKKEVVAAQKDAELYEALREKEVKEAAIQIQITEAAKNTELEEQRALEKEKKLLSEVVKPAEADRKRKEQEAEAQKYEEIKKAEAEAEKKKINAIAEAEAIKARAEAEAEAIKEKAVAEADAIAKKGKAEAEATSAKLIAEAEGLERKAEALAKMNQAGIMQMVIEKLPEMAAAVAKPLEQIDRISIIDSGSGSGVENVGGYVPAVLAKVIESVKETTGFDITEVMKADTMAARTDRNISLEPIVELPLPVNKDGADKKEEKVDVAAEISKAKDIMVPVEPTK